MLDLVANTAAATRPSAEVEYPQAGERTLEALLSIAKTTRAIYGLKLGANGFHNGQDELLLAIDATGLPVNVIAEQLMVRPSTVSKMLDRLMEKGLVERCIDVQDGRRTIIRLTRAGTTARSGLIDLRKAVDAELAKALNFGSKGSGEADDCLASCAAALGKHLRRLR